MTRDLDLVDLRGVHRERALDSDGERDLANRERLAIHRPTPTYDVALEHLDAFAIAFLDAIIDLHVIADIEIGEVLANLLLLNCTDDIHLAIIPFLKMRFIQKPAAHTRPTRMDEVRTVEYDNLKPESGARFNLLEEEIRKNSISNHSHDHAERERTRLDRAYDDGKRGDKGHECLDRTCRDGGGFGENGCIGRTCS